MNYVDAEYEYLALAAGDNEQAAFIAKLASTSCDVAPNDDYRVAWAHFLAATYRGTSPSKGWLKKFCDLATPEKTLSPEWTRRLESAQKLQTSRGWQNRYENEGVFQLEPESLGNESDLANFLGRLIEFNK